MEEKVRYKLESHNGTFCEFHDTETDEWYIRKDLVTDLLNQQDKDIKKLRQENQQLKQQLAITEKALELACANLYDINFQLYNTEMNFVDYFKQQAKEILEND